MGPQRGLYTQPLPAEVLVHQRSFGCEMSQRLRATVARLPRFSL